MKKSIKKIFSSFLLFCLFIFNFGEIFANEDILINNNELTNTINPLEGFTGQENIILSSNIIPEIKIGFQNPTYLIEKDIEKTTYYCDKNLGDCKINFDLRGTFGTSIPSAFSCENIFGFITGEENNCNPNTIIVPNGGIYEMKFKIYEISNKNNFKEKTIIINNEFKSVKIPEVNIEIQSGLDFLDGTYKCSNFLDCKLNLNLENLFTGEYDLTNYSCLWDFGSGIFETIDTNKKCNPGYVSFGSGTHHIDAKIFEKNNLDNFKTGSIDFLNIEFLTKNESNSGLIDSTNSGDINNSGTLINLKIPEVNIEIQSGLNFLDGTYKCSNFLDCKLNLNLENLFTGEYDLTNYSCLWDFGSGIFETIDTNKKCNPGYVSFGSGTHHIDAKIFEKNNLDNFKTGSIDFLNIEFLTKNESNSGETNSGLITKLEIPEIYIEFQSPSYILEKEIDKQEYFCDLDKDECRVNFNLEKSFSGISESKFQCEIMTSFDNNEKYKCNPGTVTFPFGKNEIKFRIYDKANNERFKEKIIFINNKKVIYTGGGSNGFFENNYKKIEVQSGLEKAGNGEYFCNKEKCSINLKYENDIGDVCLWNFGFGEYKEKYKKSCNPGTIYFKKGNHNVSLQIFKKGNSNNFEEKFINFVNIYEKNLKNSDLLEYSGNIINLQGNLGKEKELIGNKIICKNSSYCLINFSSNKKIVQNGFWDFGNGEIYEGRNPKTIKFLPGEYKISFKYIDIDGNEYTQFFYVEVYKKNESITKITKNMKKIYSYNYLNIAKKEVLNYKKFIDKKIKNIYKINGENEKIIVKEFEKLLKEFDSKEKIVKEKKNKIITYKTSKLKSGLKITGVTFPNSLITLNFSKVNYKTKSDKNGKYAFLINKNLVTGSFKTIFLIKTNSGTFNYTSSKKIKIEQKYINKINNYYIKKFKEKKKKISLKKENKQIKIDLKDIKKSKILDNYKNNESVLIVFLFCILSISLLFFIIKNNNKI